MVSEGGGVSVVVVLEIIGLMDQHRLLRFDRERGLRFVLVRKSVHFYVAVARYLCESRVETDLLRVMVQVQT